MRGTIFSNGIEYLIQTNQEQWNQGDLVEGTLTLKANSDVAHFSSLKSVHVALAVGNFKKIKARQNDAWAIVKQIELPFEKGKKMGDDISFDWNFRIERDGPISDKKEGVYLLYGNSLTPPPGHLELPLMPHPMIKEYLNIFENFHRFSIKEIKNKKGQLEVTFRPPISKEYSTVDSLNCLIKTAHEEKMSITYTFTVRSLQANFNDTSVEKKKKEFTQVLEKETLIRFGGINQEGIQQAIKSILDQARPKMFL